MMMLTTCKEAMTRYLFVSPLLLYPNYLQDYGFDYSDDDQANDDTGSVDLENMYYVAKCFRLTLLHGIFSWPGPLAKKEDSPEEALKAFKVIVEREEEKGDWWVISHFFRA